MEKEHVILVDLQDREIGTMDKVEAHEKGNLHRAFSIFIFNTKNEILLQQRSSFKYHSNGKWSNTCCSHPRPNESIELAAHRRLFEEMGFDCALESKFSFYYQAKLDNNLEEHEIDHVFIGWSDALPVTDKHEVSAWRYASIETIEHELSIDADKFSVWFPIALKELKKYVKP